MVEGSSLERKIIQDYVIRLRTEYLDKNIHKTCEKSFIPAENISLNFVKLSQMVGDTRSSYEINRNLSRSEINSAAKMFIALNSCPSYYEKLYWKVMYGNESRMAKFASNIIRKAKDRFKVRAQKIFAKVSSVLGFKHISYHNEGNRSTNIALSKELLDVKGIKYLSCLIAKLEIL